MHARHRHRFVAAGVAFALVAALGFSVWYQFLRSDVPPPVSLAAALESAESTPSSARAVIVTVTPAAAATSTATQVPTEESATATSTSDATAASTAAATTVPATEASDAAATSGISGTWSISSAGDSFVGYRIGEELAKIGTTEAVGRTSAVEGSVTIDGTTLTTVSLTADMTSLESDESRRDQALSNQALETSDYPTATFVLTEPVELPESLAAGEAVTVTVTGDLTLHGVTQTVQIPLDVQISDGTLVVVGSLDVLLADYAIDQPSAPIVASVDEQGQLELQLFLALAA